MALTRDQMREIDRRAIEEFGVPGVVLMENAGRGAAELLIRLNPGRRLVLICCGKGNNGGDGFVIARHLDAAGIPVHAAVWADPNELTGDARVNLEIIRRAHFGVTIYDGFPGPALFDGVGWIVDALFGTGLNGPVRPPLAQVIEGINTSGRPVMAVDIPSGLDCDTGRPLGPTVRAAHTATFVARKAGFDVPEAKPWIGEVHVFGIGAPRELLAKYGI